ncbi:uncharacterized protein LOC120771887 isoform X2 [Bactrocera tryoni]|uniref:uncharacterized protein LOC120771887 isoform X2 n=1 Tax=Bactrocera tryoni TaxID=59916 RepID=UPI001A96753A|nr:uncharacterized protein LOC120771887 isoform X2 [Bactrocera tryoni]
MYRQSHWSIWKHGRDGDSKTYSGILKAKPYGENFVVNKKECVGHVQKRMGTVEEKIVNGKKTPKKILFGKGKLTSKLIDKLTVCYGLAIRRNSDSADKMRDAIWATYYHFSSTHKNPQHQNCPEDPDTWCTWQRASASGTLSSFEHQYTPLPDDVLTAMKPIYEDLNKDELLERCVGGFTQNNYESFNQLIWKISPKILPAGSIIVQIAALIAACIFNEGISALLLIMHGIDLKLGPNSHEYARNMDENRFIIALQFKFYSLSTKRIVQVNTANGKITFHDHYWILLVFGIFTNPIIRYSPKFSELKTTKNIQKMNFYVYIYIYLLLFTEMYYIYF